ncbi:MAG: transglycosylase domain-containing protein [Myxococcales bacterium]|nr:transglycosylase domain-containing protein [Myxococcales bacterium]
MIKRGALIALAALGVAAWGVAEGLRAWARHEAAVQLRAQAAARGLAVTWQALHVELRGRVQVDGLTVRTTRAVRGHRADLTVKRIRAQVGLAGLTPTLERLDVHGVDGTVQEAAEAGGAASAGKDLGAREWPLDLTDVTVTVESHGLAGQVHVPRITLSDGSGGEALVGEVVLDLHGQGGRLSGRGALEARRGPEGWQAQLTAPQRVAVAARGVSAQVRRLAWADQRLMLGDVTAERDGWSGTADEVVWHAGRLTVRQAQVAVPEGPTVTLEAAAVDPAGPITARGRLGEGTFDVAADTWPHPTFVAVELDRLPLEGAWVGQPAWQAQASGALLLGADGPLGRTWPLTVVADGALDALDGQHPLLGPEPLTDLGGHLALDAVVAPGSVAVTSAVARRGGLTVRARGGFVDDALGGTVAFEAAVDPVDCQAAVDAVPASVLGPWQGLTAEGTWRPQVAATIPLGRPLDVDVKIRGVTRRCTFTGMRATRGPDPDVQVGDSPADLSDVTWLNQPFRFRVRAGLDEGVERWVGPGVDWVELAHLPGYVGGAAYLTEEMNFWRGGAISPGLIGRAVATNLAAGRFVYGGSTVTQQLVKNLFFARDKTLLRKIREGFVAARVTDAVPKARILALYLNCIEFGPNVYGVGAAARYYFGKPAVSLTVREAIFLAMLKPAPLRGAWYKRKGSEPDFPWWRGRVVQVADRLLEAGLISHEKRDAALAGGPLRWVDGRYVGQLGGPAAPPGEPSGGDPSAAEGG